MNLLNRGQTAWFWKPDIGLAVFQAKISHTTYQTWRFVEKKKRRINVVTNSLSTRSSKEKVRSGREKEREMSGWETEMICFAPGFQLYLFENQWRSWLRNEGEKEMKPYSVGKSKLRKKRKQKRVLVILMAWETWVVLDVLNYLG